MTCFRLLRLKVAREQITVLLLYCSIYIYIYYYIILPCSASVGQTRYKNTKAYISIYTSLRFTPCLRLPLGQG